MPGRIAGGLIPRRSAPPKASANVDVAWSWANESQGLVTWTFRNTSTGQVPFVLYRSGYLFGGAFGAAIYASNPGFGVSYAAEVTPLTDLGVDQNAPPLGIVRWPDGTVEVCFVFVLAPGESYAMLEGGFSTLSPPTGAQVFEVSAPVPGSYCIGYSSAAVGQWNAQTGENLSGGPNPQTWSAIAWSLPAGVPVDVPFPVTVGSGPCGPGGTAPPACSSYLTLAEQELADGDYVAALDSAVGFIECLLAQGAVADVERLGRVLDVLRHRALLHRRP